MPTDMAQLFFTPLGYCTTQSIAVIADLASLALLQPIRKQLLHVLTTSASGVVEGFFSAILLLFSCVVQAFH
jgi:hypothetical protein